MSSTLSAFHWKTNAPSPETAALRKPSTAPKNPQASLTVMRRLQPMPGSRFPHTSINTETMDQGDKTRLIQQGNVR